LGSKKLLTNDDIGEADMNIKLRKRITRLAQLPTVLLTLALIAGFATVGHAEGIPSMVITATQPSHCDGSTLRNEIQAKARLAVWQTRVSVGTDLGVKLNTQWRRTRVAGTVSDQHG
jgi:hypothetical protein